MAGISANRGPLAGDDGICQSFPPSLKAAIPMMSDIGIIRTSDKILLVRAPNMVVTGEIAAQ